MFEEDVEYKRIQWQCRRGMLELDVFLRKFLTHAYLQLSPSDKLLFSRLLTSTDQDLFVWLMGREKPDDAALAKMVEMIRDNAKHSH